MGSGHDHSSAAIAAPRKRLLGVLLISTTILVVGLGAMFWFMVKAMARIQMPDRVSGDGSGE